MSFATATSANAGGAVVVVAGSLFDATEQYVVHQTNCVTTKGAHLSADMFVRFPYADVYVDRLKSGKRDAPGSIIVRGDGKEQRYVINAMGQFYPGKSRFNNDTQALRRPWFQSCLDEIGKLTNLTSIAFPFKIGCGAAGGDWTLYSKMIEEFAKSHPHVKVAVYQLAQETPPTTATTPAPTTLGQTKIQSFFSK